VKASKVKDSEEFEQGIRWQIDTLEHVIDEGVSEGDYRDITWQIDRPIVTDVMAALYDDGWQTEVTQRRGNSVNIMVHVADSVMIA
jgi:hypothetical protein